jgi:hypothetical protein
MSSQHASRALSWGPAGDEEGALERTTDVSVQATYLVIDTRGGGNRSRTFEARFVKQKIEVSRRSSRYFRRSGCDSIPMKHVC